jgi:hypothetical protein
MPNAKNTTYLERREKAHTINALVRIQKYHRANMRGSYIGISEFYLKILQKLQNNS